MNKFDKVCAVLAFVLGVGLLVRGIIGIFVGWEAFFGLPRILGGLPALAGWGILKCVVVAWRRSKEVQPPATPPDPKSEATRAATE